MKGLVDFSYNVFNNRNLTFYFTLVNLVDDLFSRLSSKMSQEEIDTFFQILKAETENNGMDEDGDEEDEDDDEDDDEDESKDKVGRKHTRKVI
ncbi:hypothetical protein M1146_05585 [Patescibacteria group bacterium]|nr:hypothetical protein [Patescibacteria group bacterium]